MFRVLFFSHPNFKIMVRNLHFFNILTRQSGLPFLHIPASKSGPNVVCFAPFELKIRFALQLRAIFHFSSKSNVVSPHRRCKKPTFSSSGPTNHRKNAILREFPNISRIDMIFFSFALRRFSYSSLRCFSFIHSVGNLTFKLPLNNLMQFCTGSQPFQSPVLRSEYE